MQAVPYRRSPNCRVDLSRRDREEIEDLTLALTRSRTLALTRTLTLTLSLSLSLPYPYPQPRPRPQPRPQPRVQSSEFILAKRHGKPTRLVLHPTPTLALPRQDREEIEALVSQRHSAKRRRAYELADDLQAELRALGVETDDKAREWRIV